LVALLSHKDIAVLLPCLRTIGNIITGDDNWTQVAIEAGVIPALFETMGHETKKQAREESCWVISNITTGSE